jgi:uncharacterized RDD family membrane protein YckC
MDNPYAPPAAELDELADIGPDAPLQYAGFWRRFGAFWLDGLVFLPLTVITALLNAHFRMFSLYWYLPGLLIGIGFHYYLIVRYGGTPGKLLLGMKIAMCDGSPVTSEAAILRYVVLFVLSQLSAITLVIAALHMTDQEYLSLGFLARNQTLMSIAPFWYKPVTYLAQIWIWSEFVTMMFNKKRQAVHDLMARTVVIRYKINTR